MRLSFLIRKTFYAILRFSRQTKSVPKLILLLGTRKSFNVNQKLLSSHSPCLISSTLIIIKPSNIFALTIRHWPCADGNNNSNLNLDNALQYLRPWHEGAAAGSTDAICLPSVQPHTTPHQQVSYSFGLN